MHVRYRFFLLCFLMSGFWVFSVPAQAGWLDFLFPKTETGPNPAETLRAPFADENAVIENLDPQGNPQDMTPLHLRHRPNGIMTHWIQSTIPFLLSYKTDQYKKEYAEKVPFFDQTGTREYVQFLRDSNILKTLETGRYNVSTIIQDYPVVINEGAVDGHYRWLFQMDVLVTYMDRNLKQYAHEKDGDTAVQLYTVTMQVGRVKNAPNEHGVLIESWSAKKKDL